MTYTPSDNRYSKMRYNKCGKSGLKLPAISLGIWHNFGNVTPYETSRELVRCAFDLGITHFDTANNYGPPPGSAEENFGKILRADFKSYRDEIIISTKAGYYMWPGPYGDNGSKKYLISSLDQSLKRLNLEYVDIFYHHRPDPETPLEETMSALDLLVRQGKALYVGISNYRPKEAKKAFAILKSHGTPCLIHQPDYSLVNRWVEEELLDLLVEEGVGCIAYSPLAGGRLTDRYFNGIPEDSRVGRGSVFLKPELITKQLIAKLKKLDTIAKERGQTLSQMALSWVLRGGRVTSALIGASKVSQIVDCVASLNHPDFSKEELAKINQIIK
jgi:L-glyceraldehyde 3-phosphate reductase